MRKKVHEKNNNQIASRGKIFLSAICDFCLHMILLMIIYGACASPIISHGGILDPYNESKQNFFDYVEKTGLYTFDEDGEPINSEIESTNYLGTLVKTSYYFENKDFVEQVNGVNEVRKISEKETIGYKENGKFINDNLAYYFFDYRNSSDCDLPDNIKNNFDKYETPSNYFYMKLFNFEDASNRLYLNSEIFVDGKINDYVSDKPILDSRYADVLHDYMFLNKPSSEGEELVKKFSKMYHNAVNLCFEELDKYSPSYIQSYKELNSNENLAYTSHIVGLVLSYVVSFSIYFVLIPVFLKEGRTLGMKFSRLTYSTAKDEYPAAKNIVIKDCVLFLTQAISMIFPILFLGSSNLLFLQLGGSFRFVYMLVFFALLTLSSVIMGAWSKKHQFLCEYTSLLVIKDTDSIKVHEENSVID